EAKQSIVLQRKYGLLRRGACHRARIRATRWLLAMTGWVKRSGLAGLLRLCPDAGRLDDRPPFGDLGLLERGQPFRGLLRARSDVQSQFGKALLDRRVRQRL